MPTPDVAPRVSVVIGVYNDAAHVARAVRSILEQSLRDLELIVVDDGSTDSTGRILETLAAEDARLRVLHQANAGLTRALIRGCEAARAPFIARQDSDDWSHPQRISEQLALISTDERIGFVSCGTQYVGPDGEPLTIIFRTGTPEEATTQLLEHRMGPPAHGSVMFSREVYQNVGGYRKEFLFAQDSDLWLRMAERSWIAYVPDVRYVHRKDAMSTSGARRAWQRRFGELGHLCRRARLSGELDDIWLDEARELADRIRTIPAETTDDRAVEAINYLLGSQLTRNRDGRARKYLWRVIRARPSHWKSWVRLVESLLTEDAEVSSRRIPA